MSVPIFVNDRDVIRALTPDVLLRTVEETLVGLHYDRVLNPGKLGVRLDDADGARYWPIFGLSIT